MRANLDAMLLGEAHGLTHVIEVRAMEAASHVGDVDLWHQAFVITHPVEAEGLAHIAIDNGHSCVVLVPVAASERSRELNFKGAELDGCRVRQSSSSPIDTTRQRRLRYTRLWRREGRL